MAFMRTSEIRAFRLTVLCAAVVAAALFPAACSRDDEQRTPAYDVTAALDTQGRLAVTETITYDFGSGEGHGITRDIPTRPAGQGGAFVADVSVRSPDGAPAVWTLERTNTATNVRIGDPNQTITGRHTYVLQYTLGGAAVRDGKDTRVSWNAFGTGWRTAIDRATVRLTAPAAPSGVACYAGPPGSRRGCANERTTGREVDVGATALPVGSGITVTAGFPGDKVEADPLTADRQRVTAQVPQDYSSHPANGDGVGDSGSSGGDKLIWGLVLGGVVIVAVIIGLASRGGGRGGGGGGSYGGGLGGLGGGGGGGGGVGGGAGGGGGGGW